MQPHIMRKTSDLRHEEVTMANHEREQAPEILGNMLVAVSGGTQYVVFSVSAVVHLPPAVRCCAGLSAVRAHRACCWLGTACEEIEASKACSSIG